MFVVDNKTYDLHDPESIAQIPTPNWNNSSDTFLNVTTYLDYILRVRLGNGNDTPATTAAIARKASSLMETSPIMYNPENSFKITNQLMKVGLFDEADIEFQKILNSFFSSRQDWTRRMQDVILKILWLSHQIMSVHVRSVPYIAIVFILRTAKIKGFQNYQKIFLPTELFILGVHMYFIHSFIVEAVF